VFKALITQKCAWLFHGSQELKHFATDPNTAFLSVKQDAGSSALLPSLHNPR